MKSQWLKVNRIRWILSKVLNSWFWFLFWFSIWFKVFRRCFTCLLSEEGWTLPQTEEFCWWVMRTQDCEALFVTCPSFLNYQIVTCIHKYLLYFSFLHSLILSLIHLSISFFCSSICFLLTTTSSPSTSVCVSIYSFPCSLKYFYTSILLSLLLLPI